MVKGIIIGIMALTIGLAYTPVYATDAETGARAIIDKLTQKKRRTRTLGAPTVKTRGIRTLMRVKNGQQEVVTGEDFSVLNNIDMKIEFDLNSATLRPSSAILLDELGQALTSNELKDATIVIGGHTDSDGDDGHNMKLSMHRAQAVQNYLHHKFSIKLKQIRAVGYGEGVPLLPNDSTYNKQANRRVEIMKVR